MFFQLHGLPPGAATSVWCWERDAVVFDLHRAGLEFREKLLAGECWALVYGTPARLVDLQVLAEVAGALRIKSNIRLQPR